MSRAFGGAAASFHPGHSPDASEHCEIGDAFGGKAKQGVCACAWVMRTCFGGLARPSEHSWGTARHTRDKQCVSASFENANCSQTAIERFKRDEKQKRKRTTSTTKEKKASAAVRLRCANCASRK